jgi:hypothetical protein
MLDAANNVNHVLVDIQIFAAFEVVSIVELYMDYEIFEFASST